ncbi:hypothetical protein OGAPHI_002717 [Ogataea philodendri]|uniref:Uncharacterized protein n=1 Tax=Ogataea philodendri TaxID=1378263 RepID=A0A9P8PBS1_9ASCO|nr:uncharacterized protein OGAPHI_002717 [Ogataea philodendri]KAH3668962.1 hypothetical protein OGAPHI_002717 [Ogataea philodendri]
MDLEEVVTHVIDVLHDPHHVGSPVLCSHGFKKCDQFLANCCNVFGEIRQLVVAKVQQGVHYHQRLVEERVKVRVHFVETRFAKDVALDLHKQIGVLQHLQHAVQTALKRLLVRGHEMLVELGSITVQHDQVGDGVAVCV